VFLAVTETLYVAPGVSDVIEQLVWVVVQLDTTEPPELNAVAV
jgi:hypothetical protein